MSATNALQDAFSYEYLSPMTFDYDDTNAASIEAWLASIGLSVIEHKVRFEAYCNTSISLLSVVEIQYLNTSYLEQTFRVVRCELLAYPLQ